MALLRGEGLEVSGTKADVRSPEDADALVAFALRRYGALHVLVNCAAGNFLALPEGALRDVSQAALTRRTALSTNGFRTVMDIDAVGTFNVSRCVHCLEAAWSDS